jgi:hypothetical protein
MLYLAFPIDFPDELGVSPEQCAESGGLTDFSIDRRLAGDVASAAS